jgi:hypothetical protein
MKRTLSQLVRHLYLSRVAAKEASKARDRVANKAGRCERPETDPEEFRVPCWYYYKFKGYEKWCDGCRPLQPVHRDYIRKSAIAGAALRAVLRAGKEMVAVADPLTFPPPCGDCDPCIFGRPDQCAINPQKAPMTGPGNSACTSPPPGKEVGR